MQKEVAIIGSGYVGLVTGACLAQLGHSVECTDNNKAKIQSLNNGVTPFFEPGLDELIKEQTLSKKLTFTSNIIEVIKSNEFIFLAVNTPSSDLGTANISAVKEIAKLIGQTIDNHKYIILKSTVPLGTAKLVHKIILGEITKRNQNNITFDLVSNPEFLREGSAINDFLEPDRIVCGTSSADAQKAMEELYEPITIKMKQDLLFMNNESAEIAKYACNSFLATKISFINEISNLCEQTQANINDVRKTLMSDHRISPEFLNPGIGYGGSCFPKDISALVSIFKQNNCEENIISAAQKTNLNQVHIYINKVKKHFNNELKNKTFAIWGVSYKPNTDDIRSAPSLRIIEAFLEEGVHLKVHDPKAIENLNSKLKHPQLTIFDSHLTCLEDIDALLLLTDWELYKKEMSQNKIQVPIIFDGRNCVPKKRISNKYQGMGLS